MKHSKKRGTRFIWKIIVFLIVSSVIYYPLLIRADEDYLIIRMTDAEYPPRIGEWSKKSSILTLEVDYQWENPTQNNIIVTAHCGPVFFPQVNITFVDKTLFARPLAVIEYVYMGDIEFKPGIRDRSKLIQFEIVNYVNDSIPLGRYILWFDFTNCSYTAVPVVTEKFIMDVTDENITYTFEYNNETRIVSPKVTLKASSISVSLISSFYVIIVLIHILNARRSKFRKKIDNNFK
ncbi:MAG: hypothetical protein H7641_02365 [Candidatus Heimdallarchaeota archaeon]|nr:hypothetical protein [Candidatus Heimdallarchaeota archaeon]MCK4876408.1 hypothetical protein [Candidatus Heimdallarchaeota archaeon]